MPKIPLKFNQFKNLTTSINFNYNKQTQLEQLVDQFLQIVLFLKKGSEIYFTAKNVFFLCQ